MSFGGASDTFSSKPLWSNGPSPGCIYNFPGSQNASEVPLSDYTKRTQAPSTTGTSILAIRFDKGVVMAADTLGSYGSLARFFDLPRVIKVNENIIMGGGGDYADFQYAQKIVTDRVREDEILNDGISLQPHNLFTMLTRIMYDRRSNMNPLWNDYVIGGVKKDGTPFLGHVDMVGLSYEDQFICTGFGSYLATPLYREFLTLKPSELNEETAKDLIKRGMEVLFYRDARSSPKYQVATCTAEGVKIETNIKLVGNWEVANYK